VAVRAKHIFRWDLDKTYLRTEFDTLRDLVKSALETAKDKQAYPGAPALLRALRQSEGHRVCIISGSPSQMRQVLAAKLALDGVEYDEFVLKNNLRNIARGRFRALRAQVPYKLPALLESRAQIVGTPPETLFGDDAEADAIVYCLYADILAGRVGQTELGRVLEAARAYDDQRARTLALASRLVRAPGSVRRILIHLDRRSPLSSFWRYGARVVPIYNYFQAALVLYADAARRPAPAWPSAWPTPSRCASASSATRRSASTRSCRPSTTSSWSTPSSTTARSTGGGRRASRRGSRPGDRSTGRTWR
jgi:hypothetical protein